MKKSKFKPVGAGILVEMESEIPVTSRGKIIVPEMAQDQPLTGKVVGLGKGIKTEAGTWLPFTVKTGERVMLDRYGGTPLALEGGQFRLVKEENILAILT